MLRISLILLLLLIIRVAFFYINPPKIESLSKNVIRETTIFTQIKENTRKQYLTVLNRDQADLLMGIVFGEDISFEAKKKFIATGVIHVVAASGMNVSMLTAILLAFLAAFLKRQYALGLTSLIIIFYAGLADFQPSIVRAAIMALFALGAQILGRQNTSIYALFLAAFFMVFIHPGVITSISFQLSFTSTLGIILIDPILKSGFLKSAFFDDFRTTLAAQIATTPFLLFLFGTYSAIAIFVNILVLWTIPPLMLLGMMSAILGFVMPIIASIVIYLSMPLLSYFIYIVEIAGSYITSISLKIPITIVIGYYLILLAVIIKLSGKKHTL